jgi:hypothetical protein
MLWKPSKDFQFASAAPFIDIIWDLEARHISVTPQKQAKYRDAITERCSKHTYVLSDVQKLHGKLINSCLIIPQGRVYLTGLEAMTKYCHNSPFMSRTAPRSLAAELLWWFQLFFPVLIFPNPFLPHGRLFYAVLCLPVQRLMFRRSWMSTLTLMPAQVLGGEIIIGP